MSAITVRNLDESITQRLKLRAAQHNRSMEAEVRAILTAAVGADGLVAEWLALAKSAGGVELDLPERSTPRELDLS